jgi:serine/threonine protein kinase
MEIEELRRNPNGEGHTVHRYIRGKMLGKGGFAKVYLCTSLDTNRAYAVKVVPKANLVKSRARQKVRQFFKKVSFMIWRKEFLKFLMLLFFVFN